jgi:hypothetical protein
VPPWQNASARTAPPSLADYENIMDMTTDAPRDPLLDRQLAELRGAMASLDAPRGVEKELMAAFTLRHAKQPWYRALSPAQWRIGAGIGALAMAAAVSVLVLHAPVRLGPAGAGLPYQEDGGYFIALDSLERIEREAGTAMIEAELPRTELASLGIPVTPENAGDSVRAELLVSADGRPLAVRLTSIE